MHKRLVGFIVCLSACAAMGAELATNSQLDYEVSTSLTLMDALVAPKPAGHVESLLPIAEPKAGTTERGRALGLSEARAAFDWKVEKSTELVLVLRPDAATRRSNADAQPIAREFDRRAGTPYRPMPKLELLDAYQLSVMAGDAAKIGAGVYEDFGFERSAFPQVLEFGLNVRFPEKFSAVAVTWHPNDQFVGEHGAKRVVIKTWALAGDGDRAEVWDQSSKSYDQAPTTDDRYSMGALLASALVTESIEFEAFGAVGDAEVTETDHPSGKRNELDLAAALVIHAGQRDGFPIKIVADARFQHEKWNLPDVPHSALTQKSAALTASVGIGSSLWGLLGYHAGLSESLSERDSTASVRQQGQQGDVGLLYAAGPGTQLSLLACQEQRSLYDDAGGATFGGFGTRTDDTFSIRRFGFEVSYNLRERR